MPVRRHPVTALILLITAGFGVRPDRGRRPAFTRDLSNVATLLMIAAGAACLVRAALRPDRMRRAWIGIGLGTLCYAFGEGAWTWAENVRGREAPFPSLPDVGYLAMVPLMTAGLLMVPVAR